MRKVVYYSNELYHHGVKGQKWGIRRYQNEDGTLTEEGKKRQAKKTVRELNNLERDYSNLGDEIVRLQKQANRRIFNSESRRNKKLTEAEQLKGAQGVTRLFIENKLSELEKSGFSVQSKTYTPAQRRAIGWTTAILTNVGASLTIAAGAPFAIAYAPTREMTAKTDLKTYKLKSK